MASVLVLGSGAREHALSWKLASDSGVTEVICAPVEAGLVERPGRLGVDDLRAIEDRFDKELRTLRELGVVKAQGYLLGKPMAIEDARAYVPPRPS